MDGQAHGRFERVIDAFSKQIDGADGGAAVAVYHRGELVVDLWGGDRTVEGDPWERDTLAMCFSTTKGVASFALHLQVEAGLVDYDEPVATYWPEFAQNGKEGITVRHVLSHSSGLHRIGSVIDHAHHMLDWDHMVAALAAEPPAYEPGTKSGYHALTYGWLVGEIVQRVTGRDLDEVVRNDIAAPLGVEGLFLGCPPEERHRVAPLEPTGALGTVLTQPLKFLQRGIGRPLGRAVNAFSGINPRRITNTLLPRGMEDVVASPEIMDSSIPAANGFFTARALATMYAVFAGGGAFGDVRMLSPDLVTQIGEEQNNQRDLVLVLPMRWRLGYHRVIGVGRTCPDGFGHFGFGGSGAFVDPSRELAVAMVCNRGTGTPVGDARLVRLARAAIESADDYGEGMADDSYQEASR